MPLEIEHEGQTIKVWTEQELDNEVKGLKITNENLKTEKQEALDKLKELKELVRQAEEAKAKAEGDNETLRRIADEREAEKRQAVEDERKKFADLLSMAKKEKIDNFLTGILDEIRPADVISAKHLRKLLKADYEFDFDFDSQQYKVTGEGVTSLEDLKRVLTEGSEYKRYLAGSGATGGGAAGGHASGVGKNWSEMTEKERLELKQNNPTEFYRNLRGN